MSAAFSRCSFQFPRYSSEKLEFGDLHLAVGRAVGEIVDHLGHRAQMIEKRRRIVREIGEHEAAIALDIADPLHVVLRIGDIEIRRIAFRMRHRSKRAVGAEHPGMIGAGEGAARTAVDHAKPCTYLKEPGGEALSVHDPRLPR